MGHVRMCDGNDGKGCPKGAKTRVIVSIDHGTNLRDLCRTCFTAKQSVYLADAEP